MTSRGRHRVLTLQSIIPYKHLNDSFFSYNKKKLYLFVLVSFIPRKWAGSLIFNGLKIFDYMITKNACFSFFFYTGGKCGELHLEVLLFSFAERWSRRCAATSSVSDGTEFPKGRGKKKSLHMFKKKKKAAKLSFDTLLTSFLKRLKRRNATLSAHGSGWWVATIRTPTREEKCWSPCLYFRQKLMLSPLLWLRVVAYKTLTLV